VLDLYSNASLILTANAYTQSKVFAMKPTGSISGDFSFSRNSVASRKTFAGTIEIVNANIPRLTYLSQSSYPGFLLEPSRTNLFLQSNTFSGPEYSWPWLPVNITLTSSQDTSPDGTLNGWRLNEIQDIKPSDSPTIFSNFQTLVLAQGGTTQANSCISSSIAAILGITTNVTFNLRHYNTYVPNTYVSVNVGTRYICSAYVKPAGRTGVAIQSNLNGLGYLYTKFNLTDTGSVYETPNGYTASISQEANGWYRISTAATANTSSAKYFSIDLLSGSLFANEYLGSANTGIYLYGTQVEAAPFSTSTTASSYIPTTTAAVTRASDLMSGSSLTLFTNQSNPKVWTLFIDYNVQYEGTNTNGSSFLSLRDSNNNVLWYLFKTPTGVRGYDQKNSTDMFSSVTSSNSSKIALVSDGYTITVYINGNYAAFYTPTNNSTLGINKIVIDPENIGNPNNPTTILIKNIIMYPDTLAGAGCTYLTSLNT
jgi:hypothetical protein